MARNRKPREKKISLARAQRRAQIPAEKLLWKALRNREFAGFKFRRQHPIGAYVVDFACVEAKLIVEIDGESHLSSRREDERRTIMLEAEGWLVLRFWNTEVYDELEPVKEAIYRVCVQRTSDAPPSPPAPLPPPATRLQATSRSRRGERGGRLAMLVAVVFLFMGSLSVVHAQSAPSYSKDIRPFLTKYCLECHNAKTLKGTLSLETYKAMLDGSDGGAVVAAGKPDDSRLVLLIEHKDKPSMPPPKAKFQPTKAEIALLRAWVAAGAKDDGASIKVELPDIKTRIQVPPPVTERSLFREPKEAAALAWRSDDLIVEFDGNSAKSSEEIGGTYHADRERPTILDKADGGKVIAVAQYDGVIRLLRAEKESELKEHSDAVYGLAFNPDGTLLASVSADRAMKVFDVEKGKLLYTLGHATDWLYCVAWSPDGKYLVSGGVDKSIRVYEPTPTAAKLRQSVFAHEGAVLKLVFSSDSKTLYSVGEDRIVKAWDIEKMVERKVYDKQPETVLCLALREDAGQFIVGRYDGIVQLIDMKTGKVAHEFGKEPAPKRRAASLQMSAAILRGEPRDIIATLDRAGAVHTHRIDADKNQQLGMQITVEGKTKFEPVLTVTDKTGRILAESYDGHLGCTFTEAGNYSISVRDRDYRGGADFKYRLKLGEIPVVTAVFPIGLQRGTKGDVHVEGVFLQKTVMSVDVPANAKVGAMLPLRLGADVLGKAQIVVGEFPDVLGGKIPVPGTANGRLARDNQINLWSFHAKKGEKLIVEVNARRLGSRLDSVIEILDHDGQPVPRAVLRSQAKTFVTFRDHDSAAAGIRIEAWSELATNDLLYVGNELMKIQSLPTHPDADCIFFAAEGKRLGYLDTTPTHHANNTPMYKVTLHPPGTAFPPNGYPAFTLYHKNDDGGPGYGRDSRIDFDPPTDGEYQVRIADARGMGGANFGYRLTVRAPRPSFVLRQTPAKLVVSRGGAVAVTFTAERIDGFDGPIAAGVEKLPAGLHMPATTIEAGTYATTVALYADKDAAPTAKPLRPLLQGRSLVGNTVVNFAQEFELPTLIEAGDIVATTAESEIALKPGGQAKLLVYIERKKGFTGRVPLDVRGLPHGVRVLDIGLNGILVNENETSRVIVLYAEPWVQAGERPFVVLAKREGKGTEHAAKSVMLKLK